jgi:hypothetical protein
MYSMSCSHAEGKTDFTDLSDLAITINSLFGACKKVPDDELCGCVDATVALDKL